MGLCPYRNHVLAMFDVGVFLIPYLIAVVICGIPLTYLEQALGQFMSQGMISSMKICPLFQGLAYTTTLICFSMCAFYIILLAWVLYYLFASFTTVLPWSHCNNDWNTVYCRDVALNVNGTFLNATYALGMNVSNPVITFGGEFSGENTTLVTYGDSRLTDPATEFWERKVLKLSADIGQPGPVKWDLALCLLLAWIIIYFCIWKGIKLSGKISYVTVIAPYLLLIALVIRGVTLEGAGDGIRYYLLPDWTKLGVAKVWLDAAMQVCFSYGICICKHTSLGGFNRFHHNSLRDLLFYVIVNTLTSFIAGFAIFSVLGFMSYKSGLHIDNVAGSGPGLAFVAYPQALAELPVAPVWSTMFFIMLIFLGIDSQFVTAEALIVAVTDLYPRKLAGSPNKEIFTAVACGVWFLIGLTMVTEGGVYVQQIFEWYLNGRILILVGLLQCAAIAWFYGVNRFVKNCEYMLGYKLIPLFKWCWLILTPAFTVLVFCLDAVLYPELKYRRKSGVYEFPLWSTAISWTLVGLILLPIPVVMIYKMIRAEGSLKERYRFLITPVFNEVQRARDNCKSEMYDKSPNGPEINEAELAFLKM
ncbi:sodium- and chloride-dependent GABA transporter 2-like [Liolophura sinensis]|uniref:sodium- and chloride-dependent GABA transporter 2-like n=1 Tax=Liolophura sinensis TaxID=3198878 RepID=UPI0031589CE2